MLLSIDALVAKNSDLNSSLDATKKDIQLSRNNLTLDEAPKNKLKDVLSNAKDKRQSEILAYENNKKKFKILQKYGEVLQKIENLLGLLPSNLDNLSIDELTKKIEELVKTRKRNELQFIFTFYQNLYSNSLNNLLTIEKDYQQGTLSSQEALQSVKSIKKDIASHSANTPVLLEKTEDEINALISLYENTFSEEITEKSSFGSNSLVTTEIGDKHNILFEKLNENTKEMISNLGDLSTKISNFEPQVDLTKLTKDLQDTNSILEQDNWDVDNFTTKLTDLENLTVNLTDKQIDKNKESEKISTDIKDATDKASEISKQSMFEISKETFKDASDRAENSKKIIEEVPQLVVTDDATSMPTTVASQISNVIIAQTDADCELADKVTTDPNAAVLSSDKVVIENTNDAAYDLHDNITEIEQEKEFVITVKKEDDDEDDEDENKNPTKKDS